MTEGVLNVSGVHGEAALVDGPESETDCGRPRMTEYQFRSLDKFPSLHTITELEAPQCRPL